MNLRWFREHGISVVEFLRTSDILSGLDRPTLKALARAFVPVALEAGQSVMHQGETGDSMFMVASGRLQASRKSADGTESILGEICTGEIVGEAAILTDEPRYAEVKALEDSNLLRLSRFDFQNLLSEHPAELQQLSAVIARRRQEGHQQRFRPVSRSLIEFLKDVPLFAFLPAPLLREIEPNLTWLHLPAGRELMHQGEEADGLFVVVGGRLRYESRDSQGRIVRAGDFARGEIVGELALLTGDQRSATVRAMRDSELVKLSNVSVQRMLHEAPHAIFWLTRILAERLGRDEKSIRRKRFSILTVLPVSQNVDISEFCTGLKEALALHGTVDLMTPARVDGKFGAGTADLDMDNPRQEEMMVWLSAREEEVSYLILQGSADGMQWNERCLRQADKILLVGDSAGDGRLSPVEIKYPADAEHISAERSLVIVQPSGMLRATDTTRFLSQRSGIRHFHVRRHSKEDLARVARILTGTSIGLVLGGGGARGMAHIGVIQALLEHNVPIDMIGGTSAGAIMSGCYAFFQDVDLVKKNVRRFMVDQNPLNDFTFPFISVARGRKYSNALEEVFRGVRLEDLILPAFSIACNLTNSTETVMNSGLVWTALRATSSLPGIAPPLFMDGSLYVDGGLLNNLPVDAMQNLGAGKTIAIDVSSSTQNEDAEYGKFLGKEIAAEAPSFLRIMANKFRSRLKRYKLPTLAGVLIRSTMIGSVTRVSKASAEADVYARLPLEGYGLLDFKAMDQLVEIGYTYAKTNMALWKKSLGLAE